MVFDSALPVMYSSGSIYEAIVETRMNSAVICWYIRSIRKLNHKLSLKRSIHLALASRMVI